MNTKRCREQFIEKSIALYGKDSFDYSLVDYINGYTEIILICKKHGKFIITPNKHLNIVGGCPECSKEQRKKRKKMTNDEYKELVIKKHGNKYDLSTIQYESMKDKVTAICPIHGKFTINAYNFTHGSGCPKCGIEERATKRKNNFKNTVNKKAKIGKLTTENFIKKAREIHGDKYDYSKTNLDKRDKKGRVCIICPKHGEFWQNPFSHLKGFGCSKCGKEKTAKTQTLTTEKFIEKAKKVHGDKYDYSNTIYKGCYNDVSIICPIHGEYSQQASVHLNGHGCPKCANEANSIVLLSNTEEFIKKAIIIHGDKNDYKLVDYKGAKTPVTIICEKGHIYTQMPNKHLSGHCCPYCTNNVSQQEKEIGIFIKELGFDIKTNNRNLLSETKELDIIIPSKQIAIEYDGLYWHNELKKQDKKYHLNKTIECNKKGIRLIHIFEDEWINKQEIVKSRLKAILGVTDNKIPARKCGIRKVERKECKEFLNKNHIQGSVNSSIKYGLYYNNELVSVMTFCKPRKNLGQEGNNNGYELLRFCNKLDTIVIGGASKLFKYFLKEYNPKSVISYADRRWNTGEVYEKMGFIFDHFSEPNYFYIIGQQRYNRFNYRKDLLVKQGFDKNKSEHQIMLERGIYRIYDCGTKVYKWSVKEI